ncbi:sortase [Patescibacteria group bacterium]|nr:sortase [Patescibacteria group bacterium]
MTKSEIIKFLVLRSIGNFLLLFAIFGVFATFGPIAYYEAQFKLREYQGVRYQLIDPTANQNEPSFPKRGKTQLSQTTTDDSFISILADKRTRVIIPKDTSFSIVIPKIGASAKIFPNIDSGNQNAFLPILQQGIAHAAGTVFPGMSGNIYLFAHSTDNFWNVGRYNAVFYLLKNLSPGDDIIVYFENTRHNYVVSEQKIIEGNDLSYITNAKHDKGETLVLQTCWPPGTTWKRLLIIAKPK